MAILGLIESITTSLDAHKHAISVFTDIKKALDTLDHKLQIEYHENMMDFI